MARAEACKMMNIIYDKNRVTTFRRKAAYWLHFPDAGMVLLLFTFAAFTINIAEAYRMMPMTF